jgi:choline-sulfatase
VARPLRYGFILAGVALCAALAAAGGWRYARASSPVNGPIILVSIDSLRADHLQPYGSAVSHTPAIDALASDGIVFERAFAHSPETLPSHAAMLSGRLPSDTGVRDDVGFAVKDSEHLLARLLHDRGYATAGIVSTFALRKESGIAQGFTLFDDKMDPASDDVAVGGIARDGAASERIAEQWLESTNTSRCFLFLQLNEPATPLAPQERLADGSAYDEEIARADDALGRLVKYLKRHQLYDRSTIVLTSDHGEGLGAHGEQGHGLFVYAESLRVPLIIKQSAGEGAGRRVRDLVSHVDIVPTLLDLAKAPDAGGLRGQSLKPLLDGGHAGARTAYAESFYARYHFGWHELLSATDGRYHYIRAPREELYDLDNDPAEAHNLVDGPAGAKSLDPLRAAVDRMKPGPAPAAAVVPAEDRIRFDAIGDVGRVLGDPPVEAVDPKNGVDTLAAYRDAVQLGMLRQWPAAIDTLQRLVRANPDLADVWRAIAALAFDAERYDQAVEASRHVMTLLPDDPAPHLAAAESLARLRRFDDARQQAELAITLAAEKDAASVAAAHEWLARIALAKREPATAREQAALAQAADAKLPLPLYVEGRVLYDLGRFADAIEPFEQAVAQEKAAHGRQLLDLHYYYADALAHADRADEAEAQLQMELSAFPRNNRAWAALATLQHNDGRDDAAAETTAHLMRVSPTADGLNTAARLWTSFGDRTRAAEARAEAARLAAVPAQTTH